MFLLFIQMFVVFTVRIKMLIKMIAERLKMDICIIFM